MLDFILVGLVKGLISAAGGVVALIMILSRARGKARVLGVIGSIVLIGEAVLAQMYSIVLVPILARRHAMASTSLAVVSNTGFSIISGVGVVLLALAILKASKAGNPDRTRGPGGPGAASHVPWTSQSPEVAPHPQQQGGQGYRPGTPPPTQ